MSQDNGVRSGSSRISRYVGWAAIAVGALLVVAVAFGAYATSKPGFYLRYDAYRRSYDTMQSSMHRDMRCSQCHVDSRGPLVNRAALIGDFYASLVSKPYQPIFSKLATPTRAACLACHSADWSMDATKTAKVPHPAHLRVITEPRDCVTCHKWVAHEEVYMAKHTAMPFSTVCASFECHVGTKPADDCKNCHHQLQQSLATWRIVHPQTVRSFGANACFERCHSADQCRMCHTTGKTPVFETTISEPAVQAIEKQHVKSDWLTQHGTFALQDQSKCMICHVSEVECQDCHSHRPPFHFADNNAWLGPKGHGTFAKDPRRCLECHQPDECNRCHDSFGASNAPRFPAKAKP